MAFEAQALSKPVSALTAGISGLNDDEVEQARARGAVNQTQAQTSRSLASIISANVFTRFNAILAVLLAVVLVFGSPRDALFGIILVLNAAIGIIQEWRAKATLDRLSIVSASKVRVIRGGVVHEISPDEIVQADAIMLGAGEQIATDGQVLTAQGIEVDESLLTGESVPVAKKSGDTVMSGSFVLAGQAVYQATKVGTQAYAAQLAQEARAFHLSRSELRDSINLLLRVISWAMGPVALALFFVEYRVAGAVAPAAVAVVSGLVGMIPQGLVLLTSMAFAIGVIRLGRRKALVQELAAVETLARVDVFCFDKTGTLTTGRLNLARIEPVGDAAPVRQIAGAFARAFPDTHDPMLEAVARDVVDPGWKARDVVAFSPVRKWSAAGFDGHGHWVAGAPEVILGSAPADDALRAHYEQLMRAGFRVLVLAKTAGPVAPDALGLVQPVAFLLLHEELRKDAPQTIAFFHAQSVRLKVISGDSPLTAAAIAKVAGVPDTAAPMDGKTLPEDGAALALVMEEHAVFGRIGPQQKKAMVAALQASGHTVAMLGDGVNDVLAIKQADLGITVGSAASASKAVAQIILTDGRFSLLPQIVGEGRRILANIERVAVLFLTKTVYATVLILAVSLLQWPFPLLPRHFSLIDAFTIGIPAFFLSLGPSSRVFDPGLLKRVLRMAVPCGVGIATLVLLSMAATRAGYTLEQSRSLATLEISFLGLGVLAMVARPVFAWRGLLVLAMAIGVALAFALPVSREFFALSLPVLWR